MADLKSVSNLNSLVDVLLTLRREKDPSINNPDDVQRPPGWNLPEFVEVDGQPLTVDVNGQRHIVFWEDDPSTPEEITLMTPDEAGMMWEEKFLMSPEYQSLRPGVANQQVRFSEDKLFFKEGDQPEDAKAPQDLSVEQVWVETITNDDGGKSYRVVDDPGATENPVGHWWLNEDDWKAGDAVTVSDINDPTRQGYIYDHYQYGPLNEAGMEAFKNQGIAWGDELGVANDTTPRAALSGQDVSAVPEAGVEHAEPYDQNARPGVIRPERVETPKPEQNRERTHAASDPFAGTAESRKAGLLNAGAREREVGERVMEEQAAAEAERQANQRFTGDMGPKDRAEAEALAREQIAQLEQQTGLKIPYEPKYGTQQQTEEFMQAANDRLAALQNGDPSAFYDASMRMSALVPESERSAFNADTMNIMRGLSAGEQPGPGTDGVVADALREGQELLNQVRDSIAQQGATINEPASGQYMASVVMSGGKPVIADFGDNPVDPESGGLHILVETHEGPKFLNQGGLYNEMMSGMEAGNSGSSSYIQEIQKGIQMIEEARSTGEYGPYHDQKGNEPDAAAKEVLQDLENKGLVDTPEAAAPGHEHTPAPPPPGMGA